MIKKGTGPKKWRLLLLGEGGSRSTFRMRKVVYGKGKRKRSWKGKMAPRTTAQSLSQNQGGGGVSRGGWATRNSRGR